MESIWNENPEIYTSISNESKEVVLHPFLVEIIKSNNYNKILDYGCGDGSLMKKLGSSIQISLYDKSSKVLQIAEKNLELLKPEIFLTTNDLPDDYFDCIILSLVLMTIPDIAEVKNVLNNIQQALNTKGQALIAITHPCFREYPFSTFHTSFTKENFDYFKEGSPFSVTLEDELNGNDITFTDFHWSLSHTMNMIIDAGMKINSVYEIKDESFTNGYQNTNFSPYMVICCGKE